MALSRRSSLLALVLAALAAPLALAGCGPSAAQLKEAREARYQGTRDEVFLAVTNAISPDYKVERSDPAEGALITNGRWFEKDGTYEDRALGSDAVLAEDGSVFLAFLVKVVGDAPPFQIAVQPEVDQVRSGYSALYHMKPDDPQLPGWVKGKVDDLQLALHQRLKGKFITPPGTAPAQ